MYIYLASGTLYSQHPLVHFMEEFKKFVALFPDVTLILRHPKVTLESKY